MKLLNRITLMASMGLALGVFATASTASDAAAADACTERWVKCIERPAKPGQARKQARQCDAAWRKCVRKDKKACKKSCRATKKAAKKACRKAFGETQCALRGKAKKECKKDAREARSDCMKAAKENCNKVCK